MYNWALVFMPCLSLSCPISLHYWQLCTSMADHHWVIDHCPARDPLHQSYIHYGWYIVVFFQIMKLLQQILHMTWQLCCLGMCNNLYQIKAIRILQNWIGCKGHSLGKWLPGQCMGKQWPHIAQWFSATTPCLWFSKHTNSLVQNCGISWL